MPAVLLEAGSIINRDEELKMNSPQRRDVISTAVTAAVKEFCKPLSCFWREDGGDPLGPTAALSEGWPGICFDSSR